MDEGLLHSILGKICIPKNQACERIEPVKRVGHQQVESIGIATSRTLDEFDRSHVSVSPAAGPCVCDVAKAGEGSIQPGVTQV